MLCLGKVNSLYLFKKTVFGVFLKGDDSDQEVLLPNKYVPTDLDIGDKIEVFLYTDSEDRIVATTLTPKISLHKLAVLTVKDVTKFGSFLDWGLEKDLFLPFSEQDGRAEKGDKVTVRLCLDERTDRLFASAKFKKFTNQEITVKEGDQVDLVVGGKSDLGYQVVINNTYIGLAFSNKIFQPLSKGDQIKGFIEKVRDDGKIDVSLQKKGYVQVVDSQELLIRKLQENSGVLYLTDKSDPKLISQELMMSKAVFKKCVGALYKKRKIKIEQDRIVLCS
ncbi:MAG: GntR family transcriptional regulator [Chlamydiae bacterium CG10_big_fil_rev_8_21_14_0_10_42_34]|nr:MAG: GntR family transcriptional regulator [Chlamydiae bacterium CG10_big_fil_rev_8_21_14_0_10_42_34]